MHLALVTHNVIRGDGQGRVNYEIVRCGLTRGHRVTLIADRVAPELLEEGATWIPVRPRIRWPAMFKVAEFAMRSDYVLWRKRDRFDAICGNGFTLWATHDVNCVHFVHRAWRESNEHPSKTGVRGIKGLYQRIYSKFDVFTERLAFQSTGHFVAVSRRVMDELLTCGIDSNSISIIHNGVDPDEFFPAPQTCDPYVRRNAVALFIGDLRTSRKNLDSVFGALLRIPDLELVVAGDLERSPYPNLCNRLGLSKRVRFLGYRSDLAEVMRDCDFLVAPSRYEPFGLIVLEAMATGLPVVTAATVGAAELVTPDCGYVISDPNDVSALAEAMNVLAREPALRAQMGAAGRRSAITHSWQVMAGRYWSLFESLQ